MPGSELAASSIGINLARLEDHRLRRGGGTRRRGWCALRLTAGTVSANDFNRLSRSVFVVVVVTTGVDTVEGAIEAGMAYVILYQLLDYLPSQWRNLFPILFGLGERSHTPFTEGMVEWQKRRLIERLVSWRQHPQAVG